MRQHQQQYQPTIADDLLLKRMGIEGILTPSDTVLRTAYRALAAEYDNKARLAEEASLRAKCIEADQAIIKTLRATIADQDEEITKLEEWRWSLLGLCLVLSAAVLCLMWALSMAVGQ